MCVKNMSSYLQPRSFPNSESVISDSRITKLSTLYTKLSDWSGTKVILHSTFEFGVGFVCALGAKKADERASPLSSAHAEARPRGKRLSMSVQHARSARLLIASIVLCSCLPAAGLADEFTRTHRKEIQEMVAASVKMETGLKQIQDEFARKAALDPRSSSIRAEGRLNHECYRFVQARFYAKYRGLIDNINTSPFTSLIDIRKSKSDISILRDPRKIVVETKYGISGFEYTKDFHPPLEDFVVQYSGRPDLEAKCTHYLDVTGIRN